MLVSTSKKEKREKEKEKKKKKEREEKREARGSIIRRGREAFVCAVTAGLKDVVQVSK